MTSTVNDRFETQTESPQFRVVRQVCKSDRCQVSLATCRSRNFRFALKSGRVADLNSELAILKILGSSDKVVRLVGNFVQGEFVTLVFDWCPKVLDREFRRRLKISAHFTDTEISQFCGNISSALALVHSHGVVHADLKLGNVFIDRIGNFVLGDFGAAFFVDALPEDATRGSLLNMAPEIFKAKFPSYASDVWSFAVCVFELAMLRSPFDAADQAAVIENILLARFAKIPITRPRRIRDCVTRCMVLEEHKRPSAQRLARIFGADAQAGARVSPATTERDDSQGTTPRN